MIRVKKEKKRDLTQRMILRKKASYGFSIDFTSGKVNQTLVVLRAVLNLHAKTNDHSMSQLIIIQIA